MKIVFDDSPFVQLRFQDLNRIWELNRLGFRITFEGWRREQKFVVIAENEKTQQAFKFFFNSYADMMTWSRGERFKPNRIVRFFLDGTEEEVEEEPPVDPGFGRLLEIEG